MAQTAPITNVSGTVQNVNPKGFLLDNGQWYNWSPYGYAGPLKGLPGVDVGQTVALQVKNDRFIHTFLVTGTDTVTNPVPQQPTPQAPQVTPSNVLVTTPSLPQPAPDKSHLINLSIETRQTLLKTLAVAQPAMFADLDNIQILTEIVRNLEQFVLEDLISANAPEPEPDVDDLLEEDGDI